MSSLLADAVARTWEALDAGDVEAAWRALEPLRPELGTRREVADVWLRLLVHSPQRAGRLEELRAVLAGFPADAALVHEVAGLLLREDEPAPLDEPRAADGPAALAAAALTRCLREAGEPGADAPDARALRAALHVRRGSCLRLLGPEHDAQALADFETGLALAPGDAGAWYDLGLCHKYAGRFAQAVEAFRTAVAHRPDDASTLWNLALCATGAGLLSEALEGWRRLGLDPRAGDDGRACVLGLGRVQVRQSTGGPVAQGGRAAPGARVRHGYAWAEAHSPCHGLVLTSAGDAMPARPGDTVLWDGVPLPGDGAGGPGQPPCFPLLAVLARGR
jgi:hypothetical protein